MIPWVLSIELILSIPTALFFENESNISMNISLSSA